MQPVCTHTLHLQVEGGGGWKKTTQFGLQKMITRFNSQHVRMCVAFGMQCIIYACCVDCRCFNWSIDYTCREYGKLESRELGQQHKKGQPPKVCLSTHSSISLVSTPFFWVPPVFLRSEIYGRLCENAKKFCCIFFLGGALCRVTVCSVL